MIMLSRLRIATVWGMSLLGTIFLLVNSTEASSYIVKDGQPQAQIVVAAQPPRMTRLAALELQSHIEQISGATLPIVTEPTSKFPVAIYVGRSRLTDEHGVSDEGLDRDAYRIISGDNWLILLGHDSDYTPTEPWARGPNPQERERVKAQWQEIVGEPWGNPIADREYRHYSRDMDLWDYDERGSLNAVYGFLRSLGVEWYMPGDFGSIVPKQATINLPKVNITRHADFAIRHFMMSPFFSASRDDLLWYLRLGLTKNDREVYPHGMRQFLNTPEMKEAHPEYFAIYGGKPSVDTHRGHGCHSSQALLDAHVRYVRTLFDHYNDPRVVISIMPDDGLGTVCGCSECSPQATPERGWNGRLSDYVWGYVNRVAQEVYKSHPDRKVSCYAYAGFQLPPEKIETLSPNLLVSFDQQRHQFGDPQKLQHYLDAREAWQQKFAPGVKMRMGIHLTYSLPGQGHYGMPVYLPHYIADDLRRLKGVSEGEFVSQSHEREDKSRIGGINLPGFSHLNTFVTARCYWDADQDIDQLLNKYYDDFYGPAATEMKAFVEYCEANYMAIRKDAQKIAQALELLAHAEAKAPIESVYGQRVALVTEHVKPLKDFARQRAVGRGDVPEARVYKLPSTVRPDPTIRIDGRLDESAWERGNSGALHDNRTGEKPGNPTFFKLRWADDALYLGIACRDDDMGNLNITTTRDDETAIWRGDNVEILIETQEHSYYQIVVSPAGHVMDLDRIGGGLNTLWSSQAEVATHHAEDGWTVEMRIPVADEAHTDPLHNVVGRMPNQTYPWYFNIGRVRVRGEDVEISAFSPTGKKSLQVVQKFGKLYVR